MSILSTNKRIIKVGQDYSAGENIGIYDHTISSRNWTPDITYASESAYSRSTAYTNDWIVGQYANDLTATNEQITNLSGDIDYISGVAITAHQSLDGYLTKASGDEYYQPKGSYATLTQLENTSGEIVNLIPTDFVTNETLEQTSGNIVNLIPDTSEFITNASAEATYQPIGNYLSSNALEGYATQDWVGEQGYITDVDLSNYYKKNETSGADELANAFSQIGPGGDEEVNELVHSNSANWNDVSSKLDTTAFSDVSSTFLTAHQSLDGYATQDWVTAQGYITGVDLSEYAERAFVLSSIESATSGKLDVSSFASVSSDFLTNEDLNGYATESFVENVSGDITALIPSDYATTAQVDSISSVLSGAIDYVSGQVDNKLETTAFSNVSGTFLTAVDLSPYATTAEVDTLSSMLSGAIDYVSANAGDEFPISADEAIQYVENNSATINDVNTSYQTNSGTFLTAHQAISAEEWNDCYDNVNTNSGVWGGDALPISAGPGIKVNLVDNTLVFSNDETLLWSGDQIGSAFTITASEPLSNFNYIYINGHTNDSTGNVFNFFADTRRMVENNAFTLSDSQFTPWGEKFMALAVYPGGEISPIYCRERQWGATALTNMNTFGIYKVVGINRKN